MGEAPTFPPLLTGRAVREGEDAFACATAACRSGEAGAGDLFWSGSEDVLDAAIVLEPEVSAGRSLQMMFTAMVAFGDSFGAVGPPETGVFYRWPNEFLINAARIGSVRTTMDVGAPDDVPAWLAIGLNVRIRPYHDAPEPGYDLLRTSLWDEGAGDLDRTMLLESYARHLLTWIHNWNEDGFRPVHDAWMARLEGRDEVRKVKWQGKSHSGKLLSIDEDGNLLIGKKTGTVSLPVEAVVERSSG